MYIGFIQRQKAKEIKLSRNDRKLFYFIFLCVISVSLIQVSYAQTDSNSDNNNNDVDTDEQVTLSDDLLSDPIAQDILKKIEQTRKYIAELEQKEFEENQAKQNLEERRALALESLQQDLEEWERLWEKHSSRNAFESFVSKKPEYVKGVFWDQFEFKEQKVKAGREALKQVLLDGGSLQDARAAYNEAAKIKKIELIEMNAQFNVKHNLAYSKQQQLFNSTGQFHPSPAAETSIAQYYTDYRLDPVYLLANPEDDHAAEHDSNASSDVQCRPDYVVVHRTNQNDYVCIRESTAEIWQRHEMGTIVDKEEEIQIDENSMVQNVVTNPGTQCKEGYTVLYNISESNYQCVSESTAENWLDEGIGEVHDLLQYISGKDQYKIVLDEAYEINQEILRIDEEYALKQIQLEAKYRDILKEAKNSARQTEKDLLGEFRISDTMTNDEFSKKILDARANHESEKEQITKDKSDAIISLELELKDTMLDVVEKYENDLDIEVIWNTEKSTYEAVPRI